MRKDGFTVCAKHYIKCLRQEGRYATAHVYESALRSFTMFCALRVYHSDRSPVEI